MIKKLNVDLTCEHAAAIQYIQHSGVITNAVLGDIKKEILLHENEEAQQAIALADQIDHLGGFPTVKSKRLNGPGEGIRQ